MNWLSVEINKENDILRNSGDKCRVEGFSKQAIGQKRGSSVEEIKKRYDWVGTTKRAEMMIIKGHKQNEAKPKNT